jgi:uncharacterized iron-regulated protein
MEKEKNGKIENTPESHIGATPYDSFVGLSEFIEKEKRSVDYAMLINPDTRVFALGESHLDSTTKEEVENCLTQLKEKGFTHLGLEFFGVEMQQVIEDYIKDKNEKSKEILLEHLRTYSEKDAELYLKVIEKAIALGIKVIGLDMTQKYKDSYETSQEIELLQERNQFMSQRIETILLEDEKYRIIIFTGSGHIQNEDDGTGSITVNLRNKCINVVSVLLSGRIKRPYYQGPDLGETAQHIGLAREKFLLPAQKLFPNARMPFDWIVHIPLLEEKFEKQKSQ